MSLAGELSTVTPDERDDEYLDREEKLLQQINELTRENMELKLKKPRRELRPLDTVLSRPTSPELSLAGELISPDQLEDLQNEIDMLREQNDSYVDTIKKYR